MKSKAAIDETWIKASVIGTIWASSEIVLGSFLHNLKIPFSGNILTAVGIIILISVSYLWKEKGLFWRAGLICAIMKTMSPSAVIFGPMIAIISESILLEMAVRLLGKSVPGYLLGAMLAMTWNLFQKLANLIIFYGFNIVELYKNLIQYAQKQLHIHYDIFWSPILILLVIYCLLGIISATIGMKVGRKLQETPAEYKSVEFPKQPTQQADKNQGFNYSLAWLFADLVFIVGALILLNNAGMVYWIAAISGIVSIWLTRYKRAIRQLSKPKFWVYFVLITMFSTFVITKIQSGSFEKGLLIGIQMNFRAIIVILGFAVLGTEMYNPRIRNFFLKTSFKQLPLALELSFDTLPAVISTIPDLKTIAKSPVSIIYLLISQVESRLEEAKKRINHIKNVFIITGSAGQGKTTFLQGIIAELKTNNIETTGIYSPRIMENDTTTGYDIIDISTNRREAFLRLNQTENSMRIGKFEILPQGLAKGIEVLNSLELSENSMAVIDEVGKLELDNFGWAESIQTLLQSESYNILLVVRDSFVNQVVRKWNLNPQFVFTISETDYLKASKDIIEKISGT